MMLVRFHNSDARFRLFLHRFHALRMKRAFSFHPISTSFPSRARRFLFPAHSDVIRNEAVFCGQNRSRDDL